MACLWVCRQVTCDEVLSTGEAFHRHLNHFQFPRCILVKMGSPTIQYITLDPSNCASFHPGIAVWCHPHATRWS